jgi:hypothetical protein
MWGEAGESPDWRDAAAYAPLLDADRSLFAGEWLRRDAGYRAAAEQALYRRAAHGAHPAAAAFGLVDFEAPHRAVPDARPMWRSDVHPYVLAVAAKGPAEAADVFDLHLLRAAATIVRDRRGEHLLLSDGLRGIRLDGPAGALTGEGVSLRYRLEGLASVERPLLTLRRLLAFHRTERFSRTLHPNEPRARRWILMLRAWDAKCAGASQREIASVLLSRLVESPRWRIDEPSLRSQAQRLVRSARLFANGGYRALLQ